MTIYLRVTAAALLVAVALPAWAARDEGQYDYAKVIDVQPVTEIVQVPVQQQVCREVPVQRRVAEYRSPAPAIFGAVLGGFIGNQIGRSHGHGNRHGNRYGYRHGYRQGKRHGQGHGHHDNRVAATVAGAVIGGAIASGVQYRKYPARYYNEVTQVCSTETSWHDEERVVAWDVSYRYRGQVYHSRMDEPPGERIQVRVNVAPVFP